MLMTSTTSHPSAKNTSSSTEARRSASALHLCEGAATDPTARLSRRRFASFWTAIAASSGNAKRDATASLAKAQRRGSAHRRSDAVAKG
jgi:hypothetical protein